MVREAFGLTGARSADSAPEGLGVADRLRPRSREWEGPAPSGVGGMSEAKSVTPSPSGAAKADGDRSVNECSGTVITSGELALNDSFGKVLPLSIVVRLEK